MPQDPSYYTDDDLKKLCGCGNCSLEEIITKGCTCAMPGSMARFPILDTERLHPCKRQQYVYILQKEANEINEAFGSLFADFRDSLLKNKIDVRDVIAFVKSSSRIKTTAVKPSELLHKMESSNDLYDFFIVFADLCSWFNHHPLGSLIKRYGTDDDKEAYRKFTEEDMMKYLQRSVTEIPKDGLNPDIIEGSGKFKLKIDHPRSHGSITGQQIIFLKGKIADALKIPIECLQLHSISKGCLELHFSIPFSFYDDVFPLADECYQALENITVDNLKFIVMV